MNKDTIYRENKYGIVKDRYGNFRIGKYNFRYQSGRYFLDMRGVTTKKGGVESLSYTQWADQMLPSDYPFEISEDIFNKINNIIRSDITEVKNILSLQPKRERSHLLHSKFVIQDYRFDYVCSISCISDISDYEYFDEIRIGKDDYLELKYSSTSLKSGMDTNVDNCYHLSDPIYDYIKGKALQISVLLKNLCASIYNPSALDIPV